MDIWKLLKKYRVSTVIPVDIKRAVEKTGKMFKYKLVEENSLILYSLLKDWPVVGKITEVERGTHLEIRCEDTELAEIILKLLATVLE